MEIYIHFQLLGNDFDIEFDNIDFGAVNLGDKFIFNLNSSNLCTICCNLGFLPNMLQIKFYCLIFYILVHRNI